MVSLIDHIDDFLSLRSFIGEECLDSYVYTNLGSDGKNYAIIIQVIDDEKFWVHVSIDGLIYNRGMEISSLEELEIFYHQQIEQHF
jgi:hypothetical protein